MLRRAPGFCRGLRALPQSLPFSRASLPSNSASARGISTDMLVSLSFNFNNTGSTHAELCDNLRKNSLITTPLLEYAFRKTDRAEFDPSPLPYEDKPHSIGCGATITSAHMHCIALEALAPAFLPDTFPASAAAAAADAKPKSFLDVGSGSGYVSAVVGNVFAALKSNPNPVTSAAAAASRVVGVDISPGLIQQAAVNVEACNPALVKPIPSSSSPSPSSFGDEAAATTDSLVTFTCADAFSSSPASLPHAPYDAIHCGVASPAPPASLLSLLKPGGRAIVPVQIPNSPEQELLVFVRKPASAAAAAADSAVPQSAEEREKWINDNFNRSFVMRCVYSLASSSSSSNTSTTDGPANAPTEARAIDPRLARLSRGSDSSSTAAAASPFAQYFKDASGAAGGAGADAHASATSGGSGATAEERAAALEAMKAAQRAEHAKLVSELAGDLARKQEALEQSAAELRAWQAVFVARTGAKPAMKDMGEDAAAKRLLGLVKELRVQVSKAERALEAVQAKKI